MSQFKKKSTNTELAIVKNSPPRTDFTTLLEKALITFKEQSLMDDDAEEITLDTITLRKAKANSVLDSIQNLISMSHLNEIVAAEKHKFRREEELTAMNPLLESFKMAAISSKKTLEYLIKQQDKAMAQLAEFDEEEDYSRTTGLGDDEESPRTLSADRVVMLQEATTRAIDNLNKVTAGLTRLIQLERFSGTRPWGNSRGVSQMKNSESGLLALGEESSGKKKPRKLSKAELAEEVDTDDEDEDDDY